MALPSDWVDRPISALLSAAVAADPDHIAVDDGERISYAALWAGVVQLAAQVQERVPPGGAVGVLLPGDAGFVRAILACFVAGRPCIPLDLNYPRQRLMEVLEDAAMAAVIASAAEAAALPAGLPRIDPQNATAGQLRHRAHDPDAPAVILYTSGSTGRPKGIVNSSAALLQRVRQYIEAGQLTAADRFLTLSSPCTIAGLRETLTPLLTGATLHLGSPRSLGLRALREMLQTSRITVLNAVPAMLRSLIAAGGAAPFASLRLVRLGGDVLFWSDIPRLRAVLPPGCAIQIGYSSTESTGSQWFVRDAEQDGGPFVPIGYLLPDNEAAVLRDDGMPAAPGEPGALLIRSRFVALGQWQAGRVVPGAISADPEDPTRRVLTTGDLVCRREDGLMVLIGRTDRQVKINGQRAEPAELEAVLRRHPHVADAAVLTLRQDTQAAFVAFAVAGEGASTLLLRSQLRAALRGALPRWMQPARLHLIDAIPRLPAGKADVVALRALDEAGGGRAGGMGTPFAPATPEPVRRAIGQAWRAAFGRDALHRGLAFDEAGGDSLRLMQLVFHVETLLGAHLPLDALMLDMTPADMAMAVARTLAAPAATMPAGGPPVLLLPGLNGDEPLLAQLRAELRDRVRFRLLAYPDWRDMVSERLDLDGFVERLAAQVPPGEAPVVLAGYSFGGAMADRLARRLRAGGRQVALLLILDTPTAARPPCTLPLPRLTLRWGRQMLRAARRGQVRRALTEFIAHHATHARLRPLLRQSVRIGRGGSGSFAFAMHGWLQIFLRFELVQRFAETPAAEKLPCHMVLFRSDGHPPGTPDDLGWGERVETVQVVRLGGDHHSMLDARHRRELSTKLAEAVAAATAAGPPTPAGADEPDANLFRPLVGGAGEG